MPMHEEMHYTITDPMAHEPLDPAHGQHALASHALCNATAAATMLLNSGMQLLLLLALPLKQLSPQSRPDSI